MGRARDSEREVGRASERSGRKERPMGGSESGDRSGERKGKEVR